MFESIAANIASSILIHNFNKWKNKFKGSKFDFQEELTKVIYDTLTEYDKQYKSDNINKIPFYKSQIIVNELMKFRFTSILKIEEIKSSLDEDSRVLPPNENDIKQFLEIFNLKVSKSTILKDLFIDENYKEEIFNISESLKSLRNVLSDTVNDLRNQISNFQIENTLKIEWGNQIEEIKRDLEKFKPFSALERVTNLEKRILNYNSFSDKNFKSKFLYLKGTCSIETKLGQIDNDDAEVFINAYNLNPHNLDYKAFAGLSYYVLGDNQKVKEISTEILNEAPINHIGWALSCYVYKSDVIGFIKNEVPEVVKKKKSFKINVGYWLLLKKHISRINELEKLGLAHDYVNLQLPKKITLTNKDYWRILSEFILVLFYEKLGRHSLFTTIDQAPKDTLFNFSNKLFGLLTKSFKETELAAQYSHIKFQYHYTNFQISLETDELYELKKSYDSIQNRRPCTYPHY